ncbi:MAG: hypothetical protein K2Z81_11480 [Cyanobacteria bacterium]|nr:hypothetical protein [Cyanobacteriota bacterium]
MNHIVNETNMHLFMGLHIIGPVAVLLLASVVAEALSQIKLRKVPVPAKNNSCCTEKSNAFQSMSKRHSRLKRNFMQSTLVW